LGTGNKDNGRSTEKDKEAIQQEKVESSRTNSQKQSVAREQEYPFELTLKEVG